MKKFRPELFIDEALMAACDFLLSHHPRSCDPSGKFPNVNPTRKIGSQL